MAFSAFFHVALRVEDIDRSTRFYEHAFGGRVVVDLELEPDFVHSIFGGQGGTKSLNRHIAFGDWAIELFQLIPGDPVQPTEQTKVGLMHFCARVDDVPATVERMKEVGGTPVFPIRPWNGYHWVYVADPDGHVVELLDTTLEECIRLTMGGGGGVPDHTSEAT
jgi:catechol 2,3-dioxygenase-like lactoylglutathione lyase family enzyme